MIGNISNEPDEIIYLLLYELKIPEEKYNNLFNRIKNGLYGYNEDNLNIIRYINDNNNQNGNHIILGNDDENINNVQDDDEEEESYDEEEIAENEDKLKYRENEIQNIDDYFNYIRNKEKDGEEEEEEEKDLLDENDIGLRRLTRLTEEKYNNLINSNNNFFRLGYKIIY
jgi:hypothetical protein